MRDQDIDLAVVIGRFQPFHNGHARLLARALGLAPRVVIVLGSAFAPRSPRNPFTWDERAAMIEGTLSPADRARVTFAPVRDVHDDVRWTAAVRDLVRLHAPDAREVALVGHDKDASTYYLHRFPGWRLVNNDGALAIDATSIRRLLFGTAAPDVLAARLGACVPPSVCRHLLAVRAQACFAALTAAQ